MKKSLSARRLFSLAVSFVAVLSCSGCLSISARTKLEPRDKHPIYPSFTEYAKIEEHGSNQFLVMSMCVMFPFDLVFDTVLLPVDLTMQALDSWWEDEPKPKPDPDWMK